MGLALFVYGERNDLNMEVERVDDDADALNHLGTCIDDMHHTFSQTCGIFGTHFNITQEEFDEWVETGSWSPELTKMIKDRFKEYKSTLNRLDPAALQELSDFDD